MRTPKINQALEKAISKDRLAKYLAQTFDNLDEALALYEKNCRLSEAFYTPLQCLEVCLRNHINDVLCNDYGADWFQNGNPHLKPDALIKITTAISQLTQDQKAITTGAVVAELSFGFWVGLMGPGYDATLWRKSLFRVFRIGGVHPKRLRVHGRLNALRRFRNRIAHHEPIFHRPVDVAHAEIVETIAWMSPEASAWTAHHSRFPAVFASA